jgi:hypothetical protein
VSEQKIPIKELIGFKVATCIQKDVNIAFIKFGAKRKPAHLKMALPSSLENMMTVAKSSGNPITILKGCGFSPWSWGWELNPYRAALQATA